MSLPRLHGYVDNALTADARKAMAGYAGAIDRASVQSYRGAVSTIRFKAATDEPRPGLFSRLACHFGIHRWVTMTTGRAGFVRFERCDRRCGTDRVVKGAAA